MAHQSLERLQKEKEESLVNGHQNSLLLYSSLSSWWLSKLCHFASFRKLHFISTLDQLTGHW